MDVHQRIVLYRCGFPLFSQQSTVHLKLSIREPSSLCQCFSNSCSPLVYKAVVVDRARDYKDTGIRREE